MEDFVAIDEMLWEQQQNSIGFIANKPFEAQELSGGELFQNPTNQYYYLGTCRPSTGEVISIADAPSLGVRVNVQSLLNGYNLISGVYGLYFIAQGKNEDDETAYCVDFFTSKEMYGNPYAYTVEMLQEKIINFTGLVNLERIEVWAWQDLDFRDAFNELINIAPTENIFLNNITLSLGAVAKKEELKIYNYAGTEYGISPADAVGKDAETLNNSTKKTLRASWAIKIDDVLKVFNEFNTQVFEQYNFKIRWYRKNPNTLLYDDYAGAGWELLNFGAEKDVKVLKEMEEFSKKYSQILDDKSLTYGVRATLLEELVSYYDGLVKEYNLTLSNLSDQYQKIKELYNKVDINELYGDYAPKNQFVIDVDLNSEAVSEAFKAIVFYNGTYMHSNELLLTNAAFNTTNQDLAAIDENVILKVQRPLLSKLNEQPDNWGHRTREINSFYCYTETNTEIANADGIMPSEISYPISVYIRDVDEGVFRPLVASDYNEGTLKWTYSVNTSTMPSMITDFQVSNRELYEEYNFDALNGERRTTAFFNISGLYRTTSTNNTITVSFMRGGALYRVSKTLSFGHQSTMGSRYTAEISIADPAEGDYIPFNGEFQLRCTVTDSVSEEVISPLALTYDWRFITDDNGVSDGAFTVTENRSTGIARCYADAAISLRPPIVECTIKGLPDINYNLIIRKGLAITTDEFANGTNIYCPDRIQFNSDGNKPLYQRDVFQVYDLENEEFIYPAWTMNYNDYFCLNATVADTSRTAYAEAKDAVEEELVVPEDEQEAEELEDFAAAGQLYYNTDNIGEEEYQPTGVEYGQAYDESGQRDELNSLNPEDLDFIDQLDESCPIGYKLVPKKENLQWEINMRDTYLYISFTLNDGTYFAQAIVLDQNEYVSSLVNEWDGKSLVLDEEHSLLMSNMLAVGTKDRNNKFTGIMMGDWTGHNDGSMDVPGLYGYQQGAQSFGFLTTGQAFIGRYGKGRIFFDGDIALISNKDKTNYINLNPEPKLWGSNPMVSTGPSSSYFLYSQVPKNYLVDEKNDVIDENGLTGKQKHDLFIKWYNQFKDDKENDYFIVDPNRGILTTGGVGANWGYIGNWIIDDGYLSYVGDDYAMYIGRPTDADATGFKRPEAIWAGIIERDKDGKIISQTPQFSVDWNGRLTSIAGSIGGFTIGEDQLSGENISLHKNGEIILGPKNNNLSLSATNYGASIKLAYGSCDLQIGSFKFSSESSPLEIDNLESVSGIINKNATYSVELEDERTISVTLGANADKVSTNIEAKNIKTLFIDDDDDEDERRIEIMSGNVNKTDAITKFINDIDNNQNEINNFINKEDKQSINADNFTQVKSDPISSDSLPTKLFLIQPINKNGLNYLYNWNIQSPFINAKQSYIENLTSDKIYVINKDENNEIISVDSVATQSYVNACLLNWFNSGQSESGESEEDPEEVFKELLLKIFTKLLNCEGDLSLNTETNAITWTPKTSDDSGEDTGG